MTKKIAVGSTPNLIIKLSCPECGRKLFDLLVKDFQLKLFDRYLLVILTGNRYTGNRYENKLRIKSQIEDCIAKNFDDCDCSFTIEPTD